MFDHLPAEILLDIFSHLCHQAPSEEWLFEQPCPETLAGHAIHDQKHMDGRSSEHPSANLKTISCINRKWRALILPDLFSNIIWKPRLIFSKRASCEMDSLLGFLVTYKLTPHVKTFTIMLDKVSASHEHPNLHGNPKDVGLNVLWKQMFSVIDPLRLTFIAPPIALAAILCRNLNMADAWSFDTPFHVLSWRRDPYAGKGNESGQSLSTMSGTPNLGKSSQSHKWSVRRGLDKFTASQISSQDKENRRGKVLGCQSPNSPEPMIRPYFVDRPWTSILLNEGSSLAVYRTYEFFHRKPPSILMALLGTGDYPNNQPLIPSTVVDLSYVAVFPLASHVQTLLANLPRLERLFIHITPCRSNSILENKKSTKYIEFADLWLERDAIYRDIFAKLMEDNREGKRRTPRVLEVRESADEEIWDMAMRTLKQSRDMSWSDDQDGFLLRVTARVESHRD